MLTLTSNVACESRSMISSPKAFSKQMVTAMVWRASFIGSCKGLPDEKFDPNGAKAATRAAPAIRATRHR